MSSILVIEDDPGYAGALRRGLEEAGHRVRTAGDGEEGLRLYIARPADLVVLDLLMPRKGGLETMRDLRRGYPAARVVAISGAWQRGTGDPLHVAQLMGADGILAKPFDMEELVTLVARLLGVPQK